MDPGRWRCWKRSPPIPEGAHPIWRRSFGRETLPFKIDVRKLKNLGLTISLPIGYELSPRGEAYLAREASELGENL